MNKEKTLIFSLSAMLFLTASFLVYSWNEPVTEMPGTYSSPINTSGTAQTKTGELTIPIIYDSEGNRNYYLNPSGNSKISSISSDLSIEDIDSRDTKTLVTKEYLDFSLSELDQTITQTSNMFYVSGGVNPTCPEGTTLFEKKWLRKTCTTYIAPNNQRDCYCDGTCATTAGWTRDVENAPVCWVNSGTCRNTNIPCNYKFPSQPGVYPANLECIATNWEAVICIKNNYNDGTPLLANGKHTSKECADSGGTVVEIEPNVRICRFKGSACPTNTLIWYRYKNWSTTTPGSCYLGIFGKDPSSPFQYSYSPCPGVVFPSHSWANLAPETNPHYFGSNGLYQCGYNQILCYGGYNGAPPQILNMTTAPITQIGCY